MLHADAMPQLKPKRYYADVSQTHKDLTNDKYRNLRRPKKVTFFCNGDRFFKGKLLFITPHRYLSFQDLLGDLTGKLPTTSSLPYGVRQIYTPSGGRKIRDIEHLQDGKEYVCAGFESFKALNYGNQALDPWSTGRPHRHTENPATLDLKGISALPNSSSINHGITPRHNYDGYPQRRPLRQQNDSYALRDDDRRYGTMTKPKVITVVRAGRKPYANIKILLNRRSVQSYERLLNDISESFGPKWKNNKVRSLYTLTGREIMSISDFFRGDSIFVAVGNEKISFTDVQDIIETLYPESPYAKTLLRSIEKQKRKAKQQMLQSLANDNQELQDKQGSTHKPAKKAAKPGIANESGSKQEIADQEEAIRRKHRPAKANKRAAVDSPRNDKENEIKLKPLEKAAPEETPSVEHVEDKPKKKLTKRTSQVRSTDIIQPLEKPSEELEEKPEEKQPEEKQPIEKQPIEKQPIEKQPAAEESSPTKEEKKKVLLATKSKQQLNEEKRKELERLHQEKRDAETKAKADLYKDMEQKVSKELAEQEKKDDLEVKEEEPPKEEKPEKKPDEKPKSKIRQAKTKEQRTVDEDEIAKKYDIGAILGDGNFAVVHSCRHRDTTNEYALKIIDKSKLRGKEHMIDNEIAIMKACDQENLVQLYDEFETRKHIYLVMEYVKGGDLFDAIKTSVRFTEPTAAQMSTDMANALFYLHSRGIVHRDVKPENLMVMRNKDNSITLKLGDFGLAVEVKAPIYTICGTPTYVAPEILSEVGYGLEVDMWAVGIITYILLCGFPPFRATDNKQTELFEYIKAGEYEFLSPYWDAVSSEAIDLIRHLLIVDKKVRYTAVDVLCHPWIITAGGSRETPANFKEYQSSLREEIVTKGRQNLAEWRENKIITNSTHNTSSSQL